MFHFIHNSKDWKNIFNPNTIGKATKNLMILLKAALNWSCEQKLVSLTSDLTDFFTNRRNIKG